MFHLKQLWRKLMTIADQIKTIADKESETAAHLANIEASLAFIAAHPTTVAADPATQTALAALKDQVADVRVQLSTTPDTGVTAAQSDEVQAVVKAAAEAGDTASVSKDETAAGSKE